MAQLQDYDYRSEEVKEILGTPPKWIIRYGSFVVVLGLLFTGFVFYLIKFPDKIPGNFELNSLGNMVEVAIPENGYLDDFFVMDGFKVEKDQPLAVIKNGYDFADFLSLREHVDSLSQLKFELADAFFKKPKLNLGPFKNQYNSLAYNLINFQESVKSDFSLAAVGELRSDLREAKKEINDINGDKYKKIASLEATTKQLLKIRKRHRNNEGGTGDVMRYYFRDSINLENDIEALDNEIETLERRVRKLGARIKRENNNKQVGNIEYWDAFRERLFELQDDLRAWERKNVIKAPIRGKIIQFCDDWSPNLFFRKNDSFLGIVPHEDSLMQDSIKAFFAQVEVSSVGFGKVEKGQEVIVKFNSYPFRQFGVVRGRVNRISSYQRNETNFVEVMIPNPLVTSFGKTLEASPKMFGKAEILTRERRFLERIFEQFYSVFRNH